MINNIVLCVDRKDNLMDTSIIDKLISPASMPISVSNAKALGITGIKKKSQDGFSPLHYAAKYSQLEAAKELINKGHNIYAVDNDGYIPLDIAIQVGDNNMIYLLEYAKKSLEGMNLAITQHGDIHDLYDILFNMTDINILNTRDFQGFTILQNLIRQRIFHEKIANLLIRAGADINLRDKDTGHSHLTFAALNVNQAAMEFFLKKGADINDKNDIGWTALHYVAASDILDVDFLINAGADLYIKDIWGNTPLDLAFQCYHHARNDRINYDPMDKTWLLIYLEKSKTLQKAMKKKGIKR